ncbi:uncharacterized [Tachysurus ichikawai]
MPAMCQRKLVTVLVSRKDIHSSAQFEVSFIADAYTHRNTHTPLKHFHSGKRKCDKLAAVALVTQSPLVRSEPPLPAVGTAHLSPAQPHYPISKPLQRPPHHWSLMSLQSACEYMPQTPGAVEHPFQHKRARWHTSASICSKPHSTMLPFGRTSVTRFHAAGCLVVFALGTF